MQGIHKYHHGSSFLAHYIQGMLDNLSQPVAFATAPLGTPETQPTNHGARTKLSSHTTLRRDGSLSSDTDIEEPMVARFARRLGMSGDSKKSDRRSPSKLNAQAASTPNPDEDFDEGTLSACRLTSY
jgi:hypothetical protein